MEGDSLTEGLTKYTERATQAEECMAQMEENFEEKIFMMNIHKPPQQAYFQQPSYHAAFLTQQQQLPPNKPPSTINILAPQQYQPQQSC